jgi:hypothetical protein
MEIMGKIPLRKLPQESEFILIKPEEIEKAKREMEEKQKEK